MFGIWNTFKNVSIYGVCLLLSLSAMGNNSNNYFVDAQVQEPEYLIWAINQSQTEQIFHFISHGKPGALLIEGQWLAGIDLAEWMVANLSLSGKEKLHIYGCNFAQGEVGLAAVAYLEKTLGISVAASDDVTGKGGNWRLEVGRSNGGGIFPDYAHNLQVNGEVFRDFNGNGTRDTNEPLIPGISVELYDTDGNTCGTATTTVMGSPNYSITKTCTGAVRVEFSIPANEICVDSGIDFSALSGQTYGSSVQFLDDDGTANFAVQSPADYNCGVTDSLLVYIPCWLQGDPLNPVDADDIGNLDWFVGYKYSESGVAGIDFTPEKINGTVIGATWGTAYSRQADLIFTSAFLRRHIGLGQLGSGGIYTIDPATMTPTTFYDLDANGHRTRANGTAPAYGEGGSFNIAADNGTITYLGTNDALTGVPSGLGVIGTNDTDRDLPKDASIPCYDPAAYDQVGKVSLGGLEISDDGKYLFVMNLYSRMVFRLELDDVNNPTAVVSVDAYPVPDPGCSNGTYRPFALKYARGKLYAGLVCSGENGGSSTIGGATDLYAYVYELNNPTGTASFNTTPVISFPLNYDKGHRNSLGDRVPWGIWSNSASLNQDPSSPAGPMLSDIDFTENGDLLLAFMDRTALQWGWNNYQYLKSDNETNQRASAGELLIAGKSCSTGAFILENDGSYTSANGITYNSSNNSSPQGPGGQEFFYDTGYRFSNGNPSNHREAALGSVASVYGLGEVYVNFIDPIVVGSDGGAAKLSIYDGIYGTPADDLIGLYDDGGISNLSDNFGKASGLGEIAFTLKPAPIEIGNRVFFDADADGIQDAGEAGIDGVVVELIKDGSVIAAYTTTNNGQFYFRNDAVTDPNLSWVGTGSNMELLPFTEYTTRISNAEGGAQQLALNSLNLTTTDASVNGFNHIDSDATIVSTTNADITITTGDWGGVDHTLDYGFRTAPTCVEPAITAGALTASCTNGTPNNDASLQISTAINATAYNYAMGSTYDTGNAILGSNQAFDPTTDLPLQFGILNNPTGAQDYTIRVFNGASDCYEDVTITLLETNCPCSIQQCLPIIVTKN
ncbi:MAG: SdrD B-like domain-containing protein [Chitinophagales bacterium]